MGALSACGVSKGLRFNAIKDDNGTVVGYSVRKSIGYNPKTISIPAEHLGKPVTKIEDLAFNYCERAENVYIPDSITEIGNNAFIMCNQIKNVYITDLTLWCNVSFGWSYSAPMRRAANLYLNNELITDLVIPDGVTAVRAKTFEGCGSITSVTLPESIKRIGGEAFASCRNLKTVTLNNGLENINDYAFSWCERLQEVVLPEGLTSIGVSAFYGCEGLLSVTIPSSIETVYQNAFQSCERLAVVYNYSDFNIVKGAYGCGNIGRYAIDIFTGKDEESKITETDDGYIFYSNADKKYLVNYTGEATKITLPSTSTVGQYEIGKYAFGERQISEVTIADGVTVIGTEAFKECESLKKVAIPDSVTKICFSAFYKCKSLTDITIPYGVTALYSSTFGKCANLKQVILPDSIENIYNYTFNECSIDSIIYKGTVSQWNSVNKEDKWDSFDKKYTVYC
ncbi:MAG: leucine-rich repeat domain-containing protein, partial [Clostridia bacterium]|nr:leucine-rich repeat domain-containing protein [Clostridia bacterium]